MAANDNPAGRLHGFLTSLRDMQPANIPTWQGWSRVLQIPSHPELFEGYVAVVSLPDQIESQIRSLGMRDPSGLIDELPALKLELCDITTWGQELSTTQRRISGLALVQLNALSTTLSENQRTREPDISADELEEIQADIQSLLTDIGDAEDLNGDLRLFLADRLYEMLRAVGIYRISGTIGLRHVLDETVGAWQSRTPATRTESEKEVAGKFWQVFGRVALVFSFAVSSLTIAANIDPSLSPPAPAHVYELSPGTAPT
jgi:hypothetical protein